MLLPTRRFLHTCKVVDSPLCTFCCQEDETITHLLWQCDIVQTFWGQLLSLLQLHCTHCDRLVLSEQLVLFGYAEMIQTDKIIDFILLSAKFYIYKFKLQDTQLSRDIFIRILKFRYKNENSAAKSSRAALGFVTAWLPYTALLNSVNWTITRNNRFRFSAQQSCTYYVLSNRSIFLPFECTIKRLSSGYCLQTQCTYCVNVCVCHYVHIYTCLRIRLCVCIYAWPHFFSLRKDITQFQSVYPSVRDPRTFPTFTFLSQTIYFQNLYDTTISSRLDYSILVNYNRTILVFIRSGPIAPFRIKS